MKGGAVRTVFNDLLFLIMMALVGVIIMLLTIIGEKANQKKTMDMKAVGDLYVEVSWAPGINVDIDLWGQSPVDVRCGFRVPSTTILNLVRDDLGTVKDSTNANFENMFTRGLVDGRYAFSVVLYANKDNSPTPIVVHYKVMRYGHGKRTVLAKGDVELTRGGEEVGLVVVEVHGKKVSARTDRLVRIFEGLMMMEEGGPVP